VRLIGWVSDQREKLILGNAVAHLDKGDEVLHWARARAPKTNQEGFVFVTRSRIVVHWTGKGDGHSSLAWSDIDCWGLNADIPGGPVLACEGGGSRVVIQMPVETEGAMGRVSELLRRFCDLAPAPRRPLTAEDLGSPGPWVAHPDIELTLEKKSGSALTKRIVTTVVGLALVIGGLLITPLPGPWSFPVILAGLATLATEYDWAKDALQWGRKKYHEAARKLKRPRPSTDD
jgi:uncharacterized protein (TIGR02611 family)